MHPPIPLDRIPDRLCGDIARKQSGITAIRMLSTNSRASEIIRRASCAITGYRALLLIFKNNAKEHGLPQRICFTAMHMPFIELVRNNLEAIVIYQRLGNLESGLFQEAEKCYAELDNLYAFDTVWREQNRRGPRRFDLAGVATVPGNLINKIIFKASLLSITRLASTSKTGKCWVESCLDSTPATALALCVVDDTTKNGNSHLLHRLRPQEYCFPPSIKTLNRLLVYLTRHWQHQHLISLTENDNRVIDRIPVYDEVYEKKKEEWKELGYTHYNPYYYY